MDFCLAALFGDVELFECVPVDGGASECVGVLVGGVDVVELEVAGDGLAFAVGEGGDFVECSSFVDVEAVEGCVLQGRVLFVLGHGFADPEFGDW